MQGVNSVGLLVERQPGKDTPSLFKVQIPAEPAVDEVLPLKPDPLTLLVSIGDDDKVLLNKEAMGNPMDTAKLARTLTQVFHSVRSTRRPSSSNTCDPTNYGQSSG